MTTAQVREIEERLKRRFVVYCDGWGRVTYVIDADTGERLGAAELAKLAQRKLD